MNDDMTPKQSTRLLNAVTKVMEIVEGVRSKRGRHDGKWLTATNEWCELYCAWCATQRQLSKK